MSLLAVAIGRLARPSRAGQLAASLGRRQPGVVLLLPGRAFSVSSVQQAKKKGKGAETSGKHAASTTADTGAGVADIANFSNLESGILRAIERLTHDLARLRTGGQLGPAEVEALPVKIDGQSKTKIGDVAQVVVRGRFFNVIVHDPTFSKPVRAAILASPHSLVPESAEKSDEDSTTVVVRIPPVSAESRQRVLTQANKAGEFAATAIKEARLKHHKLIRTLIQDKAVRPDVAQVASKKMEDLVKNGSKEAKNLLDGAVKVLQGSF